MNHRIVSTVVIVIVGLFAVAALLFTWAAVALTPIEGAVYAPNDPHPPARRTADCVRCHSVDEGTIPVTHRSFRLESCSGCHRPAVRRLVPHAVTMGESRCVLCHGEPARDLGMPEGHLRFESGQCLLCHPVDQRFYDRQPGPAGLSLNYAGPITHELGGVFEECESCHFVEVRATLPENHREFAVETCMDCHRTPRAE